MDAKIRKFFDSVGNSFSGGDQIPWCDSDVVAGCEREVAEAEKNSSDEIKSESIMRLSWALVHSKRSQDVQRGITMLEASLSNNGSPSQVGIAATAVGLLVELQQLFRARNDYSSIIYVNLQNDRL